MAVEYVEFVFRCHADGRKERFARYFLRDQEGNLIEGDSKPTQENLAPVAGLMREGLQELNSQARQAIRREGRRRIRRA